ncbi:SH3 domain-containing protein [Antarcticirhabdus aurantiaca]|uniref:SH3 domain-containing protein n=1 Tax=Antarcticirhabdus aurantiaca TaxID=2606717 RepID=A0ACD4NNK5_9HYPH|nr:SH3 domain-containing protein [Antarcticirhabdus aurantiaca]WAJ28398.1 SH3 domain-containing protein [Jeongeuplla avenae]
MSINRIVEGTEKASTMRQKKSLYALIVALVVGAGATVPATASAETSAYSITSVNMRAGPSTSYPVVATLPGHSALLVHGCDVGVSWCDVSWSHQRGWVSARYVQVTHRGSTTIITSSVAPALGVAVIPFDRTYWDTHYRGRAWYGEWPRYYGAPRAAAGCGDDGCGAATIRPGRAAAGYCTDDTCRGASVTRGPGGIVGVRRGSIDRPW